MNFWRLGEHNYHEDFVKQNLISMDYFNYYSDWSQDYLENIRGGGVTSFRRWFEIKKGDVIFICNKFKFFGVCIALEEYNKKNVFNFKGDDGKTYRLPRISVKFISFPTKSLSHSFNIKLTTPATFTKADTHGFTLEGLKKLLKIQNRKAFHTIFPQINKNLVNNSKIHEETFHKFKFIPGGHPRKNFETRSYSSREKKRIKKLHNQIQSNIVNQFIREYGIELVSWENKAGGKTSIDIVRKNGSNFIFYEIKVYEGIRICIREALGQLLEYAHWTGENLIQEIIIISQNPILDNMYALNYLKYLREKCKININYQRYNLETGILERPIF